MFDIGFSEMVVIAVVALIVIGPERLPGVARTIGALLGRMQRYFGDVKAEVNRELQLEDIRKMQQDLADKARAFEDSTRRELSTVSQTIESTHEAFQPFVEEKTTAIGDAKNDVAPGAEHKDPAR